MTERKDSPLPAAGLGRRSFINTAALVGLTAGVAGAWALARVLESLLFETQVRDPLLFVAAAVVLAGVTALASYLPAKRAALLDPVQVLNRP